MLATARSSSIFARRLRNGAVLLAVLAAFYALIGFLVLPLALKPRLEARATQLLGRETTLRRIEFNPFTLRARLLDVAIAERDRQRSFASLEALVLDVSPASLWNLAPVVDAFRLVRPHVDLARNADGTYSIDDIVERIAARPSEPTPKFSVSNIEIDEGSIAFDDKPHAHKIAVSDLAIGIPFLSSIPHDAKIRVTPHLRGHVDGAHFGLAANASSPFADAQKATLEWNVDALSLARYAEYVALPGGMKLTDGALTTRLRLEFASDAGGVRSVTLTGDAHIDGFKLVRSDGAPVASAASIAVDLGQLDWLARSLAVRRIAIMSPTIDARRGSGGAFDIANAMMGSDRATRTSPATTKAPRPWRWNVADALVSDGTIRFADASVTPRFDSTLSHVAFEGKDLASEGAGTVDVHFDSDVGARFALSGRIDPANMSASGHVAITALDIRRVHPYYGTAIDATVTRGTLDIAADFDVTEGNAKRVRINAGSATLANFEATMRGERSPLLRVGRLDVAGVSADIAARSLGIESVKWNDGALQVVRRRDGTFDVEHVMASPPANEARSGQRRESRSQDASQPATHEAAWKIGVRKLELDRVAADFEDRSQQPAVRLRASDAHIVLADFTSAPRQNATLDAALRVGAAGRVRVRGSVGIDPLAANVRVDANRIDIVPLRPYFESRTNVVLTRGTVGAKGRVVFAVSHGGTSTGGYKGDVRLTDVATLDRPTSQDLVRWKTLALTGVDAKREPFDLAIGAVAIDGFYARIILNDDATLNLTRLLAGAEASPPATPQASPAERTTERRSSVPTTTAGVTSAPLPPSTDAGLPVSIGRIAISDGDVEYSDYFVKPNYTAHLTNVSGSIGALSRTQAGAVDLTGRVSGTAPVELRGSVNPFARDLVLDLAGKASDVELPPLSPYSVKYAGYGIEKGKLALEVHYKIDDRKLAATNKLRLDQLTFGQHVDSPTATKLPVLLAVSLLKDRDGVINLDLPIEGTLDDPQFSIWHVLVQIVVNLVTKAVTAPFALLSSIAGGGEQLAYVDFAPGSSGLSEVSHRKLAALAKALADRPGLRIDASGRAIADIDRDGLERATLDHALRVQKAKALASDGASAPPLDSLTIDSTEQAKLLLAVYRETDLPDKPRNFFGIAKKLPAAEMEARLLASYRIDNGALTALANRRAEAVKQWLTGQGGVAAERIFIVAPKLGADGIKDSGSPVRVDFAIR